MNSLQEARAELELDPETLLVTAETADGYGGFLSQREDEHHRLKAATMKVMAASCWCLIEPSRARAAYTEATTLYRGLARPFSAVTAICAGHVDLWEVDMEFSSTPDDLAYYALALAWMLASDVVESRQTEALIKGSAQDSSRFGSYLVGHLNVPFWMYQRLLESTAVRGHHAQKLKTLARILPRILERAVEPTRMAMADRYHWRRIDTAVMPIDPELLAIGRIAHRVLANWNDELLTTLRVGNGLDRLALFIARTLEDEEGPRHGQRHPVPTPPLPSQSSRSSLPRGGPAG